ncbi:MAG: RNA 2',3'-cyclic phosphodiesterase [Myxococcales bacterium]|nr:RNA 2',3'-cyclic phosphodiesterase [Myxococcales bacterium]
MRLFFALQLPDDVKERLAPFVQPSPAISFTRVEQLHFTLAFLGETDKLDAAIAAAQTVQAPPFDVAIQGRGAFPGLGRPRVLWLGVSDGKEPLCAAADKLCAALRERGFELEDRPFKPHLTIGRTKPGGDKEARRTLEKVPLGELARFTAREIALVQSVLGPKGAKHTVLRAFPLLAKT